MVYRNPELQANASNRKEKKNYKEFAKLVLGFGDNEFGRLYTTIGRWNGKFDGKRLLQSSAGILANLFGTQTTQDPPREEFKSEARIQSPFCGS